MNLTDKMNLTEQELSQLPQDIRDALENGSAVFPNDLAEDEIVGYLEARDEHIVREKLVRVGMNGTSRLLLIAIETSQEERKRENFPLYKMNRSLKDYVGLQ